MDYLINGPADDEKVAIEYQLMLRHKAKLNGDFQLADAIRDELTAKLVTIRDVPGGVVWKRDELYIQPKAPISKEWLKMLPVYKHFCPDNESDIYDWSEQAIEEAYAYDTKGIGNMKLDIFGKSKYNGYIVGKRYMDVTIAMWADDIADRLITKHELMETFNKDLLWWLKKTLANI